MFLYTRPCAWPPARVWVVVVTASSIACINNRHSSRDAPRSFEEEVECSRKSGGVACVLVSSYVKIGVQTKLDNAH